MEELPLFRNISPEEQLNLLQCLDAREKKYGKQEFVYHAGDAVNKIGIIMDGRIQIINQDYMGNRHIIGEAGSKELFAEVFVCSGSLTIPYDVIAVEPSRVLFINYKKVITTCPSSCVFHKTLIENMISVLAEKNLMLTRKINHVTQRTTREKVLAYLSDQAQAAGSSDFVIPFDRQQLADYLCVDRSSLSSELGKLKQDGVLLYHKNRFKL